MNELWKFVVVGVTGLVLAGSAIGFVAAQTGDDSTATPTVEEQATPTEEEATPTEGAETTPTDKEAIRDQFLDDLAERLGITREQLDQALSDTALGLVDDAVADGRITEEEAARIRERIEAGEFPVFGFRPHHGFGLCLGPYVMNEVAEFLGVERSVVVEGLENDQSLAQIAEANGKSRDELKSFLLSEVEDRLSQAVENGRITQERADELRAQASDRVDELIDREGLPMPRFKHGLDGDSADDALAPTTL